MVSHKGVQSQKYRDREVMPVQDILWLPDRKHRKNGNG